MINPFKSLKLKIQKQPHNRWWLIKIPLVVVMAILFWKEVTIERYESFFWAVDWGIHELGHAIFFITNNKFLIFAGGTLIQLLAPIGLGTAFFAQKDDFSAGWCMTWLAINLFNVADYVGSVGDPSFSLLSPFGANPEHDWEYLLGELGLIQHYQLISDSLTVLASLTMIIGLIWMTWCIIIYRQIKNAKKCEYVK